MFGGTGNNAYICTQKRVMKKELGKWLMDISKYITTAVVLSSISGGITETWKILTLGFLTITISIATGLILIHSLGNRKKSVENLAVLKKKSNFAR